jgi:hypothetical protein
MATDSTRQVAHPTPGPHAGKAAEGKSSGSAGRVPASAALQPLSLALRRAVHDADGAVAELRERLAQLAALPRPAAATGAGTLLSRRLGRELSRLSAATEPARAAGAWLASLEPILHRARHESAAADRVAAWAEHRDLLRRGRELVARVKATPPAELQAYFTEGAGGKAGPFDFEKRVDPGDGGPALAVSNLRAAIVRVVDVETEEVIGRGDGRVVVTRAGAPGGATLSVTVGEHTDELRVQLEYLLTQLRDAMTRLRPPEDESAPPGGPSTWVARLAVDLDAPDAQHEAREEHRRASDEWKHVLAELAALGHYKQRLATYHLATRLIAFAPRLTAEGDRLRASLSRADARLADIGARSTRDAESDRLIIPSQYAGEYAQHLSDRDAAQQQIQRLQLALDGGVERLKLRLSKPRLFGSAELPHLRLLGGLPEAYAAQQPQLGDATLAELVGRLEALLGRAIGAPAGAEEATPPAKHGVTEVPADSNPPVPTSRPTQP